MTTAINAGEGGGMDAEARVRAAWERAWVPCVAPRWGVYVWIGEAEKPGCKVYQFNKASYADAWQAALEFTLARKEEVAEIEHSIKWMKSARSPLSHGRGLIEKLLERELADKKRGMRSE